MHTNDLDLNLIKVFNAMMRARSVTDAAELLGLTQPAASHALQRLRRALGDPLFVPTSRGMQPTPRAQRMGERVDQALGLLRSCIQEDGEFLPATTTRTFTMFISDIGDIVILPPLLAYLKKHAPHARLKAVGSSFRNVGKELETGEVDVAVSVRPVLGPSFYQQTLFKDQYVCIVGSGHPDIGARISTRQFREAAHMVVASDGTGHEVIEQFLIRTGIDFSKVLRVPHFLSVPLVVARSDLIATVPGRLAQAFAPVQGTQGIRILDHPMRSSSYNVKQFWHERLHHDPAHQWFRKVLMGLFKEG